MYIWSLLIRHWIPLMWDVAKRKPAVECWMIKSGRRWSAKQTLVKCDFGAWFLRQALDRLATLADDESNNSLRNINLNHMFRQIRGMKIFNQQFWSHQLSFRMHCGQTAAGWESAWPEMSETLKNFFKSNHLVILHEEILELRKSMCHSTFVANKPDGYIIRPPHLSRHHESSFTKIYWGTNLDFSFHLNLNAVFAFDAVQVTSHVRCKRMRKCQSHMQEHRRLSKRFCFAPLETSTSANDWPW